jgi:shikimate kinase
MTIKAACRGAATIVNAIATGMGAAFGISIEADSSVSLSGSRTKLAYEGPKEGEDLVLGCVRAVGLASGRHVGTGTVRVESEIPISRGLKSSSAVSNAVVLASARALETDLEDLDLINLGIDESIKTGVTITGAFDDACACFLGGVVVTDNKARAILKRSTLDSDITVVLHVPDHMISKDSVKGLDYSPIKDKVREAVRLALRGEYFKAMEINSKAYARVLGLSEDVADAARAKGAIAAGISGTGPATAIIARRADSEAIVRGLDRFEGRLMRAEINETNAREVKPRLL